jgi:hypothetical protein
VKSSWKFQALQLGHAFVWLWIACDDVGAIEEKSRHFPSYRAVIADATDHGFNYASDRWEVLSPVNAPVSDKGNGGRSG